MFLKYLILSITCLNLGLVNAKPFLSGFTSKQLTNELFVLKSENSNTNVGLFVGEESILLIDPVVGGKNNLLLVEAIKEISDKPIKYVINTHGHNDHKGANSFYQELGARIILNKNGKFYSNEELLTSKDTYSIDLGNESLDLFHLSSHSTDDIIIYFRKSNSLFMGDTYMHNAYPHAFVGRSEGLFKVIDKTLSLSNESTNIVTAHGRFITKKPEFLAFKKKSELWYGKIKELSEQGMSIDAILNNQELVKISEMFKPFSLGYFEQQLTKTLETEHSIMK